MSDAPDTLLVRKGRLLTPGSRTRYRWTRLRKGKTLFGGDGELLIGMVALVLRCLTIPIFATADLLIWPLARLTLARGPWFVVRLTFDGPDPRFARVAEARTCEEVMHQRRAMRDARKPQGALG